jgi:hypothetical protein
MNAKPVADMTFEEWRATRPKVIMFNEADRGRKARLELKDTLDGAVAHYLFIASEDVPDEDAALYRAAALRLINEPVDPALMAAAGKRKSNDDPLYTDAHRAWPDLMDLWLYHHRVDVDAAERAYDAKHKKP